MIRTISQYATLRRHAFIIDADSQPCQRCLRDTPDTPHADYCRGCYYFADAMPDIIAAVALRHTAAFLILLSPLRHAMPLIFVSILPMITPFTPSF